MNETIHEALLDRMPEVLRGTDDWSRADRLHLEGCADCRAAWAIVQGAGGLGAMVERRFDATAASHEVTRRLRQAPGQARLLRRGVAVLVAAAAAVTLYIAVPRHRIATEGAPGVATVTSAARFLPELDSLSTDELATLAEQVDAPASQLDIIEGQPLLDLDTTQLERVLRSLEG